MKFLFYVFLIALVAGVGLASGSMLLHSFTDAWIYVLGGVIVAALVVFWRVTLVLIGVIVIAATAVYVAYHPETGVTPGLVGGVGIGGLWALWANRKDIFTLRKPPYDENQT